MTNKTLNDIRVKGIKALSKELNPIEMIQFFQVYENGIGDYTKERRKIYKNLKINEFESMLKKFRKKNSPL